MRISDWSSDVCSSDLLLQRDVGLDAVDDHLAQRHAHAADGLFAVGAVDDQLADHRVVVRRHAIAFVDVRIHAHARAAGGVEVLDQRSEEPTSELQSLMRIAYAVLSLKKHNTTCEHPHN